MTYNESSEPARCGVGWFSTGPDDPLVNACQWHDTATLKGSWAQQNMTYEQVHEKFVSLMEYVAKGRPLVEARKAVYDNLEHAFGKRFWEGNVPLMWVAINLPEDTAVACENFYCAEELILCLSKIGYDGKYIHLRDDKVGVIKFKDKPVRVNLPE